MNHKIEVTCTAAQMHNILALAHALDVEQIKTTEPMPEFVGVYTETEEDGVWELENIVTKRFLNAEPDWYQSMADSDDFLITHGTSDGFSQYIRYDR